MIKKGFVFTSLFALSVLKPFALLCDVSDVEFHKKVEVVKEKIPIISMPSNFVLLEDVNQNIINEFINEYYSLPIKLKSVLQSIYLSTKPLGQLCGYSSPYKVKGCALSDTNEIYLDATSYRYGDLLHETIHIYSYSHGVFEDEFYSIYLEEGNRIEVQLHNEHNIYEYYVSAYLLYLNNSNVLLRLCPKTYNYFVEH